MSKQKDETKILLDADVVIHFMKAGYQMQLCKIFPGRLVILDKVKAELQKRKSNDIETFISWSKITVIPMPTDTDILKEYAQLIKSRGEGESACLAVARFNKQYIASSNLKDIRVYCELYEIGYYTTMDILVIAIENGIMTEMECDQFIVEVKNKGSKLPCNSIQEYLELKKSQLSKM
jgi:predicted nucleic acid-binding protein